MQCPSRWRGRIEMKRKSSLQWNLLLDSRLMSKVLPNSPSLRWLFLLKMRSSFARRASSNRSSYSRKGRKMNILNPLVLQWTFINFLLSANPPNPRQNTKNRKWLEICRKADSEGFPWSSTRPIISCSRIKPKRFNFRVVKQRQMTTWRYLMFSRRSKRDINRLKNTGLSINSYDLTIFIIYYIIKSILKNKCEYIWML